MSNEAGGPPFGAGVPSPRTLPFIGDDEEARGIVRRLLAAVPAGSYRPARRMTRGHGALRLCLDKVAVPP
jgi:hypothetical protein